MILDNAINYFKFVPFLSGLQLIYTIPRIELTQEGSKCWHRDGNILKEFDVFTILSEVDNNSGPFYFIPNDIIKNHEIVRQTQNIDYNESEWIRNKPLSFQCLFGFSFSIPRNVLVIFSCC